MLLPASAFAQQPLTHHLAVNAQVGYAALSCRVPPADQPQAVRLWQGVSPAIGISYSLGKSHFRFSAGVETDYAFLAASQEQLHSVNIFVPILFGGQWGRFFFLAGGGVSFGAFGRVQRTPDQHPYSITRMPQLRCRGEVGAEVGASADGQTRFMLAAYMGCGLLNERPIQRKGPYADGVPYLICDESTAARLAPITLGVTFTCLFNLSRRNL